ncbi:MAG: universal stress protein [Candidatus Nitrosotenuis sp.]
MEGGISKILVCCDGSKYSEKAIKVACDLARKYNSELTLIHVVDKTRKSDILAGGEYTRILRKYAKETLAKAQKIAKKEGFEPKIVTKEGNIGIEIIDYSKKYNADLIVVGSRGLGAVLKFLMGSISTKIANHSLCSVLIVK